MGNILSAENFVVGNPATVVGRPQAYWGLVHCYHSTRLPNSDGIAREGLCLPSEDRLTALIKELGVPEIDLSLLRELLESREDTRIHVQLASQFAWSHNVFLPDGPLFVQYYVNKLPRADYDRCKSNMERWQPYVIEMEIPTSYFEDDRIWTMIEEEGEGILYDQLDDVCIEMATPHSVPAEFIVRIHNPESP
jgi:hypothetical protein